MLWVPETPHVSACTDLNHSQNPDSSLLVQSLQGLTAQLESMALVLGFLSDTGLMGGDERAWVTHMVHPGSAAAWERTESVTGQAPRHTS